MGRVEATPYGVFVCGSPFAQHATQTIIVCWKAMEPRSDDLGSSRQQGLSWREGRGFEGCMGCMGAASLGEAGLVANRLLDIASRVGVDGHVHACKQGELIDSDQ